MSAVVQSTSRRKSFEFRMSKKVAELTQVVHMLFTKNHEKEVEVEALKAAYERNMGQVVDDAASKIEKVELQLKNRNDERNVKREQSLKDDLEKLKQVENELKDQKMECQNLRDLLIHAQNDIEQLRQGQVVEMARKNTELNQKLSEISRLNSCIYSLQQVIKSTDMKVAEYTELKNSNENLLSELIKTREKLDSAERNKDDSVARNKYLEQELRQLRKELTNRRSHERVTITSREESRNSHSEDVTDHDDELHRLRREVQRYRMELSNRELNFNRMFTEKQPVHVERRQTFNMFNLQKSPTDLTNLRYSREATFHSVMPHSPPETHSSQSPRNSASCISADPRGRLPVLNKDYRSRRQHTTLSKPRPLPREVLSAKATSYAELIH